MPTPMPAAMPVAALVVVVNADGVDAGRLQISEHILHFLIMGQLETSAESLSPGMW
jgi:hypothetical protein